MISISNQVMRMRRARGMTQADLALLCDVTRTTITNVEKQNADASVTLLQRIGLALDCELMLVPTGEIEPAAIRIEQLERELVLCRDLIQRVRKAAREIDRSLRDATPTETETVTP